MIFIDTGAFFARHYQRDEHHREAVGFWAKLTEADETLITSNFVLDEVITLLARKTDYRFAGERPVALSLEGVHGAET
ncbi:MAG: type II toxin-antitoxin system VapC family toxin [Planctomycetaceae bacterium]